MTEKDEIMLSESGVWGCSFRGPRTNNQDWIGYRIYEKQPLRMAMVLCDGVGGSQQGEKASRFMVDHTLDYLEGEKESNPDSAYFERLCNLLADAMDEKAQAEHFKGAATTWCLVYISHGKVMAGHMGDSRIYLFEDGKPLYTSRDHSLVNDLLAAGMITEEEAISHPQRNVITKAFQAGSPDHRSPGTVSFFPLKSSLQIMLCSDGFLPLYPEQVPMDPGSWKEEEITGLCRSSGDTRDNVSVLYARPDEIAGVVISPPAMADSMQVQHPLQTDNEAQTTPDPVLQDAKKHHDWRPAIVALIILLAAFTVWFLFSGEKTERQIPKQPKRTNTERKDKGKQQMKIKEEVPTPDKIPQREKETEPAAGNNEVIQRIAANMVFVPGGSFLMGCDSAAGDPCNPDELPRHEVRLKKFSIGKYEVTLEQWMAVMGYNPDTRTDCMQCPVTNISMEDVNTFLRTLNQRTGRTYRLPTEAEWECAARGSNKVVGYKFSGSAVSGNVAWFSGNAGGKPHPVGQKQPNALGLFDMSGNVKEWCKDFFSSEYYRDSPTDNPSGPALSARARREFVVRGGCYADNDNQLSVTFRKGYSYATRNKYTGFRLAL